MTALLVYRDRDLLGRLHLDLSGRFVFQYDRHWLHRPKNFPLSISLPLQEPPFEKDTAKTFFANLLPEGEVRRLLAAKFGISPGNDFMLLDAIGGDCAGALSLLPEGSPPPDAGSYRPIAPSELDLVIEAMPRRPLLVAEEGVRLSLAGAQNKLPVHLEGEDLFLPEGSFASSYILKPQIPHVADSVFNEAFCMMLAGRMGIPVAGPMVKSTGKHWYYLVKRYDRAIGAGGRILRLHQEDFCQALRCPPDRKYQSEGGPGFQDCFRVLEGKSSRPAADKKALIQWAVFNFLIGNADAHAKNFSLLISEDGLRLAPFYDLMSTEVYPDLSSKSAMKIGGKYERRQIFRRHWERFAEEAGVKAHFIFQTIRSMAEGLPGQADELLIRSPDIFQGRDIVSRIHTTLLEHCDSIKKDILEVPGQ